MTALEYSLERTVLIRATRDTVFRYFTDSERFAAWWGTGSSIDARPGGALRIRYPTGDIASGQVVELVPGERVVFTYGYEGPAKPIPPGGSRVTVTLEDRADGTLVRLRHDLPDAASRDHHVQGWRYQLALFANVAAREQHAGAAAAADAYFAAWAEKDEVRRRSALAAISTADVAFRDAYSCTVGLDDLVSHIGASQMFMPGVTLAREGGARQCQGTALVDWVAKGPDGVERGRGTNVFDFAADGRIARVVGIWTT